MGEGKKLGVMWLQPYDPIYIFAQLACNADIASYYKQSILPALNSH